MANANCARAVLVGLGWTSGAELGLWHYLCCGDRKLRHREDKLEFAESLKGMRDFPLYSVPPKQGSHAQSVPELETAEGHPGSSSSDFGIRYLFLLLLFNFIRSKGKKNPFEFLLFFLNRKKKLVFRYIPGINILTGINLLTEPSFLGYTYRI